MCSVPVAANLLCPLQIQFALNGDLVSNTADDFKLALTAYLAEVMTVTEIRVANMTLASGSIAVQFYLLDSVVVGATPQSQASQLLFDSIRNGDFVFMFNGKNYTAIPVCFLSLEILNPV